MAMPIRHLTAAGYMGRTSLGAEISTGMIGAQPIPFARIGRRSETEGKVVPVWT